MRISGNQTVTRPPGMGYDIVRSADPRPFERDALVHNEEVKWVGRKANNHPYGVAVDDMQEWGD